MRFVHMADCHIGSWREPKLREISTQAFITAINITIKKNVDFILISGDLFNTSLPDIESLKIVVEKLREVKDQGISVYLIPGSHDFSPSGKTMLDVLESAGLCHNVVKGEIIDNKLRLRFIKDRSGAKIAGMLGKRGMLEKSFYEDLDREHLEKEPGFKIFMLHTALTELKSKELEKMDSSPLSLLPKGFDYYAAGHVHERIDEKIPGYGQIVYPGPLFPNNFRELETLRSGGIYLYEDGRTEFISVEKKKVHAIYLECETSEQFESEIDKMIRENDFRDAIVTLRLKGTLLSGRVSDIDFKGIFNSFYDEGAYLVMKNTAGLNTKEFEEVKVHEDNVDDIERTLILEHIGSITDLHLEPEKEKELTENLIKGLDQEKKEGERNIDFEERLIKDIDQILR